MSEFKREQRYAVLKLKDINEALNKNEIYTLNILSHKVAKHREAIGKPPLECVCPESDWPIYEEVWDMVQRLAEGREQKIDQLQRENEELIHRQIIHLTANQLAEAAYWANPDNDPEQDDTEVVVEYMPERAAIDGEKMEAGDYLYYEECPEEGVIGPLGTQGFHGRILVIDEAHLKQLEAAAVEKYGEYKASQLVQGLPYLEPIEYVAQIFGSKLRQQQTNGE